MDEILGQNRAIEPLRIALASKRLHHAYIFHGPTGVGKFTTARAFAQYLLCHDLATNLTGAVEPCGSCPSCASFTHGGHPDLHIVVKELAKYADESTVRNRKLMNIPRDVLEKHLLEPVYRRARLGESKVFIVDEAELIDLTGQNVLLKTLEEPPPGTYIILITSNEDRLLPTIRSRCQRVAFTPLDEATVADWIAKQEDAPDARTAQWIAAFAAGSLGMAQLAQQHDLASWGATIEPAIEGMARGQYPTDLGEQLRDMIDSFAKKWVADHDNASKEAANRRAAAIVWRIISHDVQRRIHTLADTCDPAEPDSAEALLTPWLNALEALRAAESELYSNVNLSIVTDHLVSMLHRAVGEPRAMSFEQ